MTIQRIIVTFRSVNNNFKHSPKIPTSSMDYFLYLKIIDWDLGHIMLKKIPKVKDQQQRIQDVGK